MNPKRNRAIIQWPLTPYTGWGSYGIQLVQALLQRGDVLPLLACANDHTPHCDPHWLAALEYLERASTSLRHALEQHRGQAGPLPTQAKLAFMPLGNGVPQSMCQVEHPIGVTFFECSSFDQADLKRMASYELLITGSHWNQALLRQLGFGQAELVHQGVDLSRFNPASVPRLLDHRTIVIFSGGKLEARKGQDLVVAAFRELLKYHPDALLIVAWSNIGDIALETIASSPHVEGAPSRGLAAAIAPWLQANGIPLPNVLVLAPLVNSRLPNLIKQADVAVFPSRCEGGTNLMAMETLACGVPTQLSANSGHLDLLAMGMDHCLSVGAAGLGQVPPLLTQGYGGDPRGLWGETDPAELLEGWLRIAAERTYWRALGQRAAVAMQTMGWNRSMERLLALISERGFLHPCP
ncbi:MAG: glycosyltransferase family 4 protein [Cyanobacteria bacterium K_DeepCast_35m_m1_288]|nr:glycosyltransferase family 4 protein [Cyanobacteria bacterium K_DeepCast_35m_m1_288]